MMYVAIECTGMQFSTGYYFWAGYSAAIW